CRKSGVAGFLGVVVRPLPQLAPRLETVRVSLRGTPTRSSQHQRRRERARLAEFCREEPNDLAAAARPRWEPRPPLRRQWLTDLYSDRQQRHHPPALRWRQPAGISRRQNRLRPQASSRRKTLDRGAPHRRDAESPAPSRVSLQSLWLRSRALCAGA